MLYVLRAFVDDNVVGGTDPLDDLRTLELELALADLASAEQQLERRRKAAKGDKSLAGEVAVLEWAVAALSEGTPLYRAGLTDERRAGLRPFFLLTTKPVLAVVNLGEDQLGDAALVDAVAAELGDAAEVLGVCVQLEAEAAQLPAGRARRAARRPRARRGRPAAGRPRRVPPARAADVPHDRRQGEPGVDVPRRRQGARVRRRHPHRPAARVHPGRGHPLGRAARARLVEQGQGGRQAPRRGQGLRGGRRRRPRDPVQRVGRGVAWLVRDGEVLATLEVAESVGRPDARAARS